MVDGIVILRVVGMVGARLKDWVEVDGGHAQVLKVVEALLHAAQIAAEVVTTAGQFGARFGRVDIETAVCLRANPPMLC